MNIEEKKNRLFNKLTTLLKDKIASLNKIHFNLESINLIEYYKDVDTVMVKLINEELKNLYLVIFMSVDVLNLDIYKTKIRYHFYKEMPNKEIKKYDSKQLNLNNLIGDDLNEKIKSLLDEVVKSYNTTVLS